MSLKRVVRKTKMHAQQRSADQNDSPLQQAKFNLYYSSAFEGEIQGLLGAPHYSYRFAESKFVAAIEAAGLVSHKLPMPEYYNTSAALPDSIHESAFPSLHLIYRSTEQIRLLKFACNICCFAWEFNVLKNQTEIDEHPFLNQTRMLGLCNEIWVPCTFTKTVLSMYGLTNAHIIPAPIHVEFTKRLPMLESLAFLGQIFVAPLHHNFLKTQAQNTASCSEGAATFVEYISERLKRSSRTRIYLSILNPEDFRKNLDAMIRGFYHFSRSRNDAVLVIKVLTSATRFSLLQVLSDVIPKKLDSGSALQSENIVFFSEYLTEEAMSHLYSISDFYLCTSLCEGQNLPLLEAMAHGVVPVSTANTAMADYLTDQNAVIIQDHSEPNDIVHLAGTIARKPFLINRARVEDIYNALQLSAELDLNSYNLMAGNARQTVKDGYSRAAIWPRIESRLAAIYPMAFVKQQIRGNSY